MPNSKLYILFSVLGILTIGLNPFGLIILSGTLLTWLAKYIASSKRPTVKQVAINELFGVACITIFIAILTIGYAIYETLVPSYGVNHVTITGQDGDGARGMFVIWLLLIITFTLINLLIAVRKYGHLRLSK